MRGGDLYAGKLGVSLFETRFSSRVEHLRQSFPHEAGSLLSLLARVPSAVLASLALRLASDFEKSCVKLSSSQDWNLVTRGTQMLTSRKRSFHEEIAH